MQPALARCTPLPRPAPKHCPRLLARSAFFRATPRRMFHLRKKGVPSPRITNRPMTTAISSAPESTLTTHRFFLLFVLLLGTLCLSPYSESPSFGYYAFRVVAASANLHAVPNRFDFIYYSFTTMTSLGAAGMI